MARFRHWESDDMSPRKLLDADGKLLNSSPQHDAARIAEQMPGRIS
jgi:hypothetical protein